MLIISHQHGLFSFYESQQGRGGEWVRFQARFTGLWTVTVGCWLARRVHKLKGSIAMDLGTKMFLTSISGYDMWP